jgi:hypothetical protein
MTTTEQDLQQKICDDVTQLQADLGIAVRTIFQLANGKIGLERQAEIQQQLQNTEQTLERFKTKVQAHAQKSQIVD